MLWKGVYSCKYTPAWERFNVTSLPTKKKNFYCNMAMESITDAEYKHAKKVWEDFGLQNLGQYHDLHVALDQEKGKRYQIY